MKERHKRILGVIKLICLRKDIPPIQSLDFSSFYDRYKRIVNNQRLNITQAQCSKYLQKTKDDFDSIKATEIYNFCLECGTIDTITNLSRKKGLCYKCSKETTRNRST